MSYLVFEAKAQAEKAQRRILKILSYFLKQEEGYGVGEDDVVNTGNLYKGKRTPVVTDRWSAVFELVDETWAIVKPDITMAKMKTVPKAMRERFGITNPDDIFGAPFTVSTKIDVLEI